MFSNEFAHGESPDARVIVVMSEALVTDLAEDVTKDLPAFWRPAVARDPRDSSGVRITKRQLFSSANKPPAVEY